MTVIDDFRRDGAVRLRGVISPQMVALLSRGIDENIARPSRRAKIASAAHDPGRFIEDFRNWKRIGAYRRFIFESGLAAIAGVLMGSAIVRLHHDHMLTKEAGTAQPTPWHQDLPYYNIEGRQTCSFWIPVDPVDRASSLEFVAGSHKGPWLMPRSFMDAQARWFPEGSLADLPDIEADRGAWPIVGWAVRPGDAIAFDMLTLHAAGGSPRRRRAFSQRFIGEDVTHAPRPWATSPDFPGLEAVLAAGAPMDHPLFPVVWRAPGGDEAEN